MNDEIVTLTDSSTGATARILPSLGFNCFSFEAMPAGEPVEVLWSAPRFSGGGQRPSRSGIPILFPFPGRMRGSSFSFAERSYPLEPSHGQKTAIHGYALDRPWELTEHTEKSATGRFHASTVDPDLLSKWPADFVLTVTYELAGNSLTTNFLVENPGDGDLPFGLGTHAYFRLPLGFYGPAE